MMDQRGIIYTFYSFKGGVGRSMALANVAALMAKNGKRVLVIDWDLEAPGLEKYFSTPIASMSNSRKDVPGVIDIVTAFAQGEPLDWRNCLLFAHPFHDGNPVSILTAGKDSDDYVTRVQSVNWEYLFNERGFGTYLEQLREEWVSKFDFVLVDSRTGITDIGGICTIHLPDILVLLFTSNDQSLNGVIDITQRARKRYAKLPLDRAQLLALPVPSRFENFTEYKLASEWKGIFAERLTDIYKDWLPDKTTPGDVLEKLFIPYIPFWSFGEGLPVVSEGTSDPRTLGFAYDLLARLLENRLQWNLALPGDVALSSTRGPELIDQDADRFYESLSADKQKLLQQVFMRLVRVSPSDEAEDTKRRVAEGEFKPLEQEIIEKLIDSRLLYKSADSLTKEPSIEIAQDTLLKNWRRLRSWIDDNRDFLVLRQDVQSKMHEWEESNRDKSLLLVGTTLAKAEQIKSLRSAELTDSERDFIYASLKEKDSRIFDETRKRLFAFVPTVVVGVFATILLLYTYQQQTEQKKQLALQMVAQEQMLRAQQDEAARQRAEAARLLAQMQRLQDRNDELLKELLNQKPRLR